MKILLVGDSCYDIYHYGEVKRISPEAPIPIFDLKYSEKKYGMASNVYENLNL
jgi:D-beta-D-heptose 7-phosphate kinase/D-beta-D-heptose 1-phosphate adenosyltransferase